MMNDANNKTLPIYDNLFQPVIQSLKSLGGSGRPSEVHDHLEQLTRLISEYR